MHVIKKAFEYFIFLLLFLNFYSCFFKILLPFLTEVKLLSQLTLLSCKQEVGGTVKTQRGAPPSSPSFVPSTFSTHPPISSSFSRSSILPKNTDILNQLPSALCSFLSSGGTDYASISNVLPSLAALSTLQIDLPKEIATNWQSLLNARTAGPSYRPASSPPHPLSPVNSDGEESQLDDEIMF